MNLTIRPHFLGLMLLALAAFGLERLIVTDKEAIEEAAAQLGEAIEARAWERVEALLSPDFQHERRDRAETLAFVRGLVRKYEPLGIRFLLADVEVEGDTASAEAAVSASVHGRPQQMRITVVFERTEEDAWVLREVRGSSPLR